MSAPVFAFSALAALAFVVFALVWTMRRVPSSAVVAALWGLYAVYEYLMYARVLCSGECNIRVDLLLIWPVLLFATLYAAIRALLRRPPASAAARRLDAAGKPPPR